MSWNEIIKTVKNKIAEQKASYSQTSYVYISVNNMKYKVRCDCSGFVSACISVLRKNQFITSSYGLGYDPNIAKTMKQIGFVKKRFTGWDNLQKNDIIVDPGHHVEIFHSNCNGKHFVYSNGSTNSIRNSSYGIDSGSHNYKYVWRLKK